MNVAKYKMTSLGNNKWELNITPDVRSYYGVPAGEKILKMAFVFRSSDGKKEGKDTGGKDIFVDIHETGLTVRFDQPSGIATLNSGETLAMKASASMVADMKLFVGNEPIATQSNVKEIMPSFSCRMDSAHTSALSSAMLNHTGRTWAGSFAARRNLSS